MGPPPSSLTPLRQREPHGVTLATSPRHGDARGRPILWWNAKTSAPNRLDTPDAGKPRPRGEAIRRQDDAVLDPFAVYQKGEMHLRRQLAALAPWHLVNIITAYRLSEESTTVVNRLSTAALIEIIVAAAAMERDDA